MTTKTFICSICRSYSPMLLSSFMTDNLVCNKTNTSDATSGTGTAYPSGAPEFTPGSCDSIFSYMCSILYIVIFLLSVLPRITVSDYFFDICKLFLIHDRMGNTCQRNIMLCTMQTIHKRLSYFTDFFIGTEAFRSGCGCAHMICNPI